MVIDERGYPHAAAVSPRVQVVESTGSTNADLVAHVRASVDEFPHLSLVVTTDQRTGRGRLDRTWVAPAGAALAASVALHVEGLPVASRGWIPLIAGAAMVQAVRAQLEGRGHTVMLKWPNDVLVDGQKVCGILAEAVAGEPHVVVVGAGVNTLMDAAQLPVPTATSFAVLGAQSDDDVLLADWLTALDLGLSALMSANGDATAAGVRADVQKDTATVGALVAVALPDGRRLEGRAVRLDADGRLVVASTLGVETPVAAGDVVHVR